MAKLFLTTLPSQEELHASACQMFPEAEPISLYSNLLFRKVATDIEIHYDNFFAKYDLSPGRFTLLMLLKKNPEGLMPSELAQKVGVTQATISGLINSLEKAELVARETHIKDGRAFVIKLTNNGQDLLKKIAPEWYPKIMNFWGQFTAEEKTKLNALLERMSQNIHLLK
ncbi:MarR family winged helix-turn-helix transcriptional regulator [Bdellovibrio sp. NC01]|uniref:MarR family winged helix-turn-helix transcriptional regulator n=1 Tax=Bdellovibrio sp. NC01 TaxID=2220073 RepID=UPI001157344A|nr:MarR family transcriptional regulator [Bdellovibrio sp. NC01]QDK36679.1 MarR family transcriptional regulator [Bdellovibrio sp. NC01]